MENESSITPINEDLNVEIYEVEEIKQKIFTIRGNQVMMDSDVAMLYHYETKKINQTVKRNINRFPEKFCFKLTEKEFNDNWSQIVTSSENEYKKHRGKKYLPYVFTEQGIAMLSGLLKNEIAVQVSINIIEAFVEMRKFINTNGQVYQRISNIENKLLYIDDKILKHDYDINQIFDRFETENSKQNNKQKIFFQGQIWDSYSLIVDIIREAKEKIVIIDNYVDDSILKMLSKKNKNVEVVILTSDKSKITKLDVQKFNKEYPILKLAKTNKFHDRFIIIDNKELYHCGASIKDLGNKCFGINRIEDENIIKQIIDYNEKSRMN